jgi:AcrR family transcriptional regulator
MFSESRGLPVPLSAICAHAGVDLAMVHYHFENRLGLITALFERLCATWAADLDNLLALEADATTKLEIHMRQMIRNFRRYPYTTRVMTELVASSKPALAKRMSGTFLKPLVAFYERLIAQGVETRTFRQIDPVLFFFSVIGMCEFYFVSQPMLIAGRKGSSVDVDMEAAFITHTTALVRNGMEPARA